MREKSATNAVSTRISGLNHVGISVASLDLSVAFYRDLIGMEVVARAKFGGEPYETILALKGARGEVALVRLGSFQLELFEFEAPQPRIADPQRPVCDHGITHFCLQVRDIHEVYARLHAAGMSFHCPPLDFFGEELATYGRDPDGNVIELVEEQR